jgi:acetolactate synthase-1/2/3 large subunit
MENLLLLGHGAKLYKTEIYNYITKTNTNIVYSLNGKGIISDYHPLCLGMIGWKGNKFANECLNKCKNLINIGSRLDIRQIPDINILKNKNVYNFNIEQYPLGIVEFLNEMNSKVSLNPEKRVNDFSILEDNIFFLSSQMSDYTLITDVGDNQMVCANAWYSDNNDKFITSGGLGTMGFAIGGSIGASITGKKTIAICGDGGFQMASNELETINNLGLHVKIIVINNSHLKLVADFQKESNLKCISTIEGYSCPNIEEVARAYEFKYFNQYKLFEFIHYPYSCILEIKP